MRNLRKEKNEKLQFKGTPKRNRNGFFRTQSPTPSTVGSLGKALGTQIALSTRKLGVGWLNFNTLLLVACAVDYHFRRGKKAVELSYLFIASISDKQ
jgi:hypothetical protein